MICPKCGTKTGGGDSFCSNCGATLESPITDSEIIEHVGYSPRISDPAFEKYQKKSVAWSFIFSGILFIIAIIGFPIYGKSSGDIAWPTSLLYGFLIGGMFVAIAAGQTLRKKLDKTWDGVVEYKDAYRQKTRSDNGNVYYENVYVLKIRKESGKLKTHRWRNTPGLYSYYNLGDKVRHHKGFYMYEKYDKSKDPKILCAACMAMVDAEKDKCPRCKCPILK